MYSFICKIYVIFASLRFGEMARFDDVKCM